MYYTRKYEPELIRLLKVFPAAGIIGPRQAGKTSMVRKTIAEIKRQTVYLDLERNSDLNKLRDPELFLSQYPDHCVIIDEIQRMPELFPLLRSLIDESRENGRFIMLGSASPDLLRQSSESLAGRIAYMELMPFTLDELPASVSMEQNWFRGGFPESLFAPDDETAQLWLDNFIKSYTERDLPLLGLNNTPVFLYRLWSMLSHYTGRIMNYSDLADSLDVSIKTVQKYIDFYEKAYLIIRIPPYFKNISKRLVKSPKLLFSDTGILHRLWNLQDSGQLFAHPMMGSSWENYASLQIIHEAKKRRYGVFFFRTHDGAETDLVLTYGEEPRMAIEIKYSVSPRLKKGNVMAFSAIGARYNFMITPSGSPWAMSDNVRCCNLPEFLSRYLINPENEESMR